MQNTTNTFLKGMTSDMHPLTTQQQEYTDALNATLITYNGNEQMLQNDMGNTPIQDSVLGNVAQLSKGFIPLGVKEFGGIIYIASINKDGVGELGSIPSPVITYEIKQYPSTTINEQIVDLDEGKSTISEIISDRIVQGVIRVTDCKFSIGDKFILVFDFRTKDKLGYDMALPEKFSKKYLDSNGTSYTISDWPYFSHSKNTINGKLGYFKIHLCSVTDYDIYDITDNICTEPLTYYLLTQSAGKQSKWWFIYQGL